MEKHLKDRFAKLVGSFPKELRLLFFCQSIKWMLHIFIEMGYFSILFLTVVQTTQKAFICFVIIMCAG